MNDRYKALLEDMAEQLDTEGRTPLNHEFLTKWEIPADEAIQIASQLAVIIRCYAYSPAWVRGAILAAGVMGELFDGNYEEGADVVWNDINQHAHFERGMKGLEHAFEQLNE